VLSGSFAWACVRTGGSSSQVSRPLVQNFDFSKVAAWNWQLTSKLDPNLELRTNLWLDLGPKTGINPKPVLSKVQIFIFFIKKY
jgi:hypothetical protein